MKEILGLLFPVCIAVTTIYLSVTKRIGTKLTVIFLIFSLVSGFLIANYDVIKKVKYKDVEIETFERKVTQIKEDAIDDIRSDVEKQKRSLATVADTLTKMTYILADGSGRYGGIPAAHLKKIQEYRMSLQDYTDPNLDKEIEHTIQNLDLQIKEGDK